MYKYNSNRISFRFWFLSVWFEIENYSVSFSYLVISSKFYKLGHFWVQTSNQRLNPGIGGLNAGDNVGDNFSMLSPTSLTFTLDAYQCSSQFLRKN